MVTTCSPLHHIIDQFTSKSSCLYDDIRVLPSQYISHSLLYQSSPLHRSNDFHLIILLRNAVHSMSFHGEVGLGAASDGAVDDGGRLGESLVDVA